MDARRPPPPLEPLERRAYLFASLSSTGTLHVAGDGADNAIVVDVTGAQTVATLDGDSMTFASAQVRRIKVEGNAGGDAITVRGPRNATLSGGGGDDTLVGGSGDDFLAGGNGFDTADFRDRQIDFGFFFDLEKDLDGTPVEPLVEQSSYGWARSAIEEDIIGYFVEAVVGTEQADEFEFSLIGDIARRFDGRGGNDVFIEARDSSVFDPFDPRVTMLGGNGDDDFGLGDDVGDTIFAGAGNDRLSLGLSSDNPMPEYFDAGEGRDVIDLDGWDDPTFDMRPLLNLEDAVNASGSDLVVIGNDLPNRISTATGAFPVTLLGLGGDDTLTGGRHDDVLKGGDGDDLLAGAGGNDSLRGEAGNDTLGGGSGVDRLYGDGGNDYLAGHSSRDRLYGGAGVDTLAGGSGNDLLYARDGLAEAIYGASGRDAAQLDDGLDVRFSVEDLLD